MNNVREDIIQNYFNWILIDSRQPGREGREYGELCSHIGPRSLWEWQILRQYPAFWLPGAQDAS